VPLVEDKPQGRTNVAPDDTGQSSFFDGPGWPIEGIGLELMTTAGF
jgi:hypothetical protein